jgi:hypothetical protein
VEYKGGGENLDMNTLSLDLVANILTMTPEAGPTIL